MPIARALQSSQHELSSQNNPDRAHGRSPQSCMFAGMEQELKELKGT